MDAHDRISTSIIKGMVKNLGLETLNNAIEDQAEALDATTAEQRIEALRKSQQYTYKDDPPFEAVCDPKQVPFLHGKIFEALLTLDEKTLEFLVPFDFKRSKAEKANLKAACEEVGQLALPVRRTFLDQLRQTVANIHAKPIPYEVADMLGKTYIRELFDAGDALYQVHVQQPYKGYTITGDIDALFPTVNGNYVLGEFKMDNRMFYPNNAPSRIKKNNYDFQVTLYARLAHACGYGIVDKCLFLIGNPSPKKLFGVPLVWDLAGSKEQLKYLLSKVEINK